MQETRGFLEFLGLKTAGFAAAAVLALAMPLFAGIVEKDVEYREGGKVMQGYAAYDDAVTGKRPGVLIIHQWLGLGNYEKMRAKQLASLGYSVFCADIYGKGIRPADTAAAMKEAGIYRSDRKLMRKRAEAGLKELKKQKMTDLKKVAVIGYCFGGGAALELARSGADMAGTVSFHGVLDTTMPAKPKQIKSKILVLHGADDPNISGTQLQDFMKEMRNAGTDWEVVLYGNAVHGFSMPDAGNNTASGFAYNEKADKRSWIAMKDFFDEIFAGK